MTRRRLGRLGPDDWGAVERGPYTASDVQAQAEAEKGSESEGAAPS